MPTEVRFLPNYRNGAAGYYFPWCLLFKEIALRYWRKAFLGQKADKRPICFQKNLYVFQRGESIDFPK
jgi:hypothetical protein